MSPATARYRRVVLETVRLAEPVPVTCDETVRHSGDVANVARQLFQAQFNDDREHFIAFALDTTHRIMAINHLTTGTLDAAYVHARDLFRWVLLASPAAAVVVVHNHPSGSLEPSQQDIKMTHKLMRAGDVLDIPMLDHLIVASGATQDDRSYFSFVDARRLKL